MNCYTKNIRDGRVIGLPIPQHEGRTLGRGCTGRKICTDIEFRMVKQAHHSVLHQLVVMEPYTEKHLEEISTAHGACMEVWVHYKHKISFTAWLKEQAIPHGESDDDETAMRFAFSLSIQITSWQGYDINGYRFHTKEKDKKSAAQNSGARYEGIDESTGQCRTNFR